MVRVENINSKNYIFIPYYFISPIEMTEFLDLLDIYQIVKFGK